MGFIKTVVVKGFVGVIKNIRRKRTDIFNFLSFQKNHFFMLSTGNVDNMYFPA